MLREPSIIYESTCCSTEAKGVVYDDGIIPIGQCKNCKENTAFIAYERTLLQDAVHTNRQVLRAIFRNSGFAGFSEIHGINTKTWHYWCGNENAGRGSTYHGHPTTSVYVERKQSVKSE